MSDIRQAIDDLEAAIHNWQDVMGLMGCPGVNPKEYTLMNMEAEDVVVARFVDLLRLVNGDHVNLRDLVRRYEANTGAFKALVEDEPYRVIFMDMDE